MINWDDRGKLVLKYKGDDYYTISPLPFYIKRRKLLLKEMTRWIEKDMKILDYGCGDGWYVNYLSNYFNHSIDIEGCDISKQFIEKAKHDYQKFKFFEEREIRELEKYDLIYIVAVLAHLDNFEVEKLLQKVNTMLKPGGKVILFEQVSSPGRVGVDFIKREISEFHDLISAQGFNFVAAKLISFSFYNFFERRIIGKIYPLFTTEKDPYKKRLISNGSPFFRLLIRFILIFDLQPVKVNPLEGTGNYFLVAQKKYQ